jgi:hypothetical protein
LIVQRDLEDATAGGISKDWQFGITYNAALKLCTILLHAEGYRPGRGQSAHNHTLNALPHILGSDRQKDADYLNSCREKRNTVEYDHVGRVSKQDVDELIEFTRGFSAEVLRWLKAKHPTLAPPQ